MSSRFHLIPERHGQTDGQTDRFAISILRVSMRFSTNIGLYLGTDAR